MATVNRSEDSPLKQPKQSCHSSDFKYISYSETFATTDEDKGTDKHHLPLAVAIFGIGRAGSIHLENVLASRHFKLKYVVESDRDRLMKIQQHFHLEDEIMLLSESADIVFDDPKLDCIIVATPTGSHEALVTKALTKGKGVLCEKPISFNENGIEKCYNLATEMKTPLLCAFNRRFDPSISNVQRRVLDGEIGRVHMIKTVSRDCPLPGLEYLKQSCGIFHDCAIHDIDLICWIIGEYPHEVSSFAHAFLKEIEQIGDFDTVAITLKFPSGAIGMTDLSRNAVYGYDQRLEVFGPSGMLVMPNQHPINVSYQSKDGETIPPMCFSFPSRYNDSYKKELLHFHDIIKGKASASITKDSVLKISKIVSAAEESAKTGKIISISY